MTVLASGSKGNATIVAAGKTALLVDAGLRCRELLKRMAAVGEDPAALTAILITHEHVDHVAGLSVLARRLGIPVYFTEQTHRAWVRMMTPKTTMTYAKWIEMKEREKAAAQAAANAPAHTVMAVADEPESVLEPTLEPDPDDDTPAAKKDPAALPAVEYFRAGNNFAIGEIDIAPFTIPHDAADPCGFVFHARAESLRMAIATDLGYVPPNVKLALKNVDVLLIESNHDLEMLKDGPYPWSVKQRVLSRVGHLSNTAAAEFLSQDYDGGAHTIVLGHISESNNLPELALLAAQQAIANRMSLLGNRLMLASQAEPSPSICL